MFSLLLPGSPEEDKSAYLFGSYESKNDWYGIAVSLLSDSYQHLYFDDKVGNLSKRWMGCER